MRNLESTAPEPDPSYDPERLTGREVVEVPKDEIRLDGAISKISVVYCPNYRSHTSNPYRYDADPDSAQLQRIASAIDAEIMRRFSGQNILIRALQSAHFNYTQAQLTQYVISHGGDYTLNDVRDPSYDFHAAKFEKFNGQSVLGILEGFHKFKPKCDELPLKPLDVWMIFDADAYDEVSYLHPRHNTVAKDRYKLKPHVDPYASLLGVINVTT